MKALFGCNQGGDAVLELNVSIASPFRSGACYTVLLEDQARWIKSRSGDGIGVHSLERFAEFYRFNPGEIERIRESYPGVRWGEVIASERTISDYSSLDGGIGHRNVSMQYAMELVCRIVCFYESVFAKEKPDLVVCQTADSLFSHVLFEVSRHFSVPVYAVTPAWLHDFGESGAFFITNDKFLKSDLMVGCYKSFILNGLSDDLRVRVQKFKEYVVCFDGNKAFYSATKKNFGRSALSPNVRNLVGYLSVNRRRDVDVEYFAVDPVRKLIANLKRLWRRSASLRWLRGSVDDIPQRSVFLPLHFQPEQSTLVGGVFYVNQLALVEDVSKSLPLGYVLVVKEHPAGRGTRPIFHYRQMFELPNVIFCDGDSKEIARATECVVTVTGTIAVEALVLDRPVIVLGRSFFDFSDLFYRVASVQDLGGVLHRVLVEGAFKLREDRAEMVDRFLAAYLSGLRSGYPVPENGPVIGGHVQELYQNLKSV